MQLTAVDWSIIVLYFLRFTRYQLLQHLHEVFEEVDIYEMGKSGDPL